MIDETKQRNLIIIGVIVFLLFIIGVWYFKNEVKPSKTTYTIQYSPKDATVTLDGHQIKAGKVTVKNGTHELSGKRQYFTPATRQIDTSNNLPDTTIYLILSADTPEAQQYLKDHPDESNLREGASDTQITKDNDTLNARYPFIQNLPYETTDFNLQYHTNKDLTIGLDVTLFPTTNPADTEPYKEELLTYEQEALQYMRDNGIDPSKFTITYSPDPSKL